MQNSISPQKDSFKLGSSKIFQNSKLMFDEDEITLENQISKVTENASKLVQVKQPLVLINDNINPHKLEIEDEAKVEEDAEKENLNLNVTLSNGDYTKQVPFSVLCELFERILKVSKMSHKQRLLQTFFSHYKSDEYFPLIRLLLPQLDKERQTYGMKETVLGKLYVEILGISPNSEDGQRLINWRKPSTTSSAALSGDFGTAVYLSLKNRCAFKGNLSLGEINEALDLLTSTSERKEKLALLKKLIKNTTAIEQKWIVRIILKELKLSISEKTILNYFHPDALELFNVSCNLRTVCEELKDPSKRFTSINTEVCLFRPIKPMLASRHPPEEVVKIMNGNPFVIEQKFDGERIQVHKNGKEIKIFSRNSNNVTELYGDKLIPIIQQYVKVSRCILDGELLVWDSISNRYEPFGGLKSFANSGKAVSNNSQTTNSKSAPGLNIGKQLCYMVFDLLYVNNQCVMDLTLQQRSLLLKRCIQSKEKLLELVPQKEAKTTGDIVEALDNAILDKQEGIIIKNLNSTYVANERKNSWLKLKPEYIDGIGDDLDLLIVGGYFGTGIGRRGGLISHFLLGVPIPNEDPTSKYPQIFHSFCKVGTGYSDVELKELHKMLDKKWHTFKTTNPPSWLYLAELFKEKPDVWIYPQDSKILQLKAAQILPTDKYKVGFTLRFPRVVKIRLDKDWYECCDLNFVLKMAQTHGGRHVKTHISVSNSNGEIKDKPSKKRKRITSTRTKTRTWLPHFLPLDTSSVPVTASIFEGQSFCVMNGDDQHSKNDLEASIHQNGGTIVQYPLDKNTFVIAAKKAVKVQNLISQEIYDVIHYNWLLECLSQKKLLPLEPKFMLYTTNESKAEFLKEIDQYGDSFTNETTEKNLQQVFQRMDISEFCVEEQDFVSFEEKYFEEKCTWSLFRNYVIYLDLYVILGDESTKLKNSPLELIGNLIEFYGGQISKTICEEVSHIILDCEDLSRYNLIRKESIKFLPSHLTKHIVISAWVEESIKNGEDLDEGPFSVHQYI